MIGSLISICFWQLHDFRVDVNSKVTKTAIQVIFDNIVFHHLLGDPSLVNVFVCRRLLRGWKGNWFLLLWKESGWLYLRRVIFFFCFFFRGRLVLLFIVTFFLFFFFQRILILEFASFFFLFFLLKNGFQQ